MTADSEDVYLVPIDDQHVLAVPVAHGSSNPSLSEAAKLMADVGPLIGAALRRRGQGSAALYDMSPESRRALLQFKTNDVDGYFRGVLRREDGKTAHQVQLREVDREPSAAGGVDPIVAAQLAAIQFQLNRMEDTLNDVALGVANVASFLEIDQRAKIEAALRIICEVHDRAGVHGLVSDTEWQRLAGIELLIETQLNAVRSELQDRFERASFKGNPKHDVKAIDAADPSRLAALLSLQRALIGALRRSQEVLLLRKIGLEEFDETEARTALERLYLLERDYTLLDERARKLIESATQARPRSNWERLISDGIVMGEKNDRNDLAKIANGCDVLRKALPAPVERSALTSRRPMLELTSSGPV